VFHLFSCPAARTRTLTILTDGRPLTAADVKFTFESILNPATRSIFWRNFTQLNQTKQLRSG